MCIRDSLSRAPVEVEAAPAETPAATPEPTRAEAQTEAPTRAETQSQTERQTERETTRPTMSGTMYVRPDYAYIRSGPGQENNDIGFAMKGDKVTVVNDFEEWAQIRTQTGLTGFIFKELLSSTPIEGRAESFLQVDRSVYVKMCIRDSDLTLADYRHVSDVITVGGTKCGLLFGEAVCFFDKRLARDFRYKMKQDGGMLAKGRLLGLQFLTLFESDLYLTAAKEALEKADRLRQLFSEAGFTFAFETTSNQVFPILPDDICAYLRRQFDFETWQVLPNDRSVVRFCTSWSTADDHLEQLAKALKSRP